MIERIFQDIREADLRNADQQSFLVNLGWKDGLTWQGLFQSRRVLIISEAGAGKTYECRNQAQRAVAAGEPAFFIELASLAMSDLRTQLDADEEARLDEWLASQSDTATFFLDSIDELKLTQQSFEQALKRLKKGINGQLARARIVITTRPIPFDVQLVRQLLPIPPAPRIESSGETFAQIVLNPRGTKVEGDEVINDWRTVALMPLSDNQIVDFAKDQGVESPTEMLSDLKRRNAQEFARRPQDLIELCADWKVHKRIRTHRDQVENNIHVKLQPRYDRAEPAELSIEKAIEGASRLALAMLVTRRLTIRHSASSDTINDEAAIDPAIALADWNQNERKALLERPLFGFASYGRVRFHHRSVAEFLAAHRLQTLAKQGMTFRALKRLLFADTKGKTIVLPSKRAVVAWIAIWHLRVFELLRDHEPTVLLNEGDPESLTIHQRVQSLRAYADRYGRGGWRGLHVPYIQIHRFAAPELSDEITRLWRKGIENSEVRETVLSIIEMGRIQKCANIAFNCFRNIKGVTAERMVALDAMIAVNDSRLSDIAHSMSKGGARWSDEVTRAVAIRMFPKNVSIQQFCKSIGRLAKKNRRAVDGLSQMPYLIRDAEISFPDLEELRDGIVNLLSSGLKWTEAWPHIVSERSHLNSLLIATCARGLPFSKSKEWFHASVLALHLYDRTYHDDKLSALKKELTNLGPEDNSRLFWVADAFSQSLHEVADPWKRLMKIVGYHGITEIRSDRDLPWMTEALGNKSRSPSERSMILEGILNLLLGHEQWQDQIQALEPLVNDSPDIVRTIKKRLSSANKAKEIQPWEKKEAERKEQRERREAKARASWILFWREVAFKPDSAFSPERSWETAWSLWRAMSQDGEVGRSSGWNRCFIEEQFSKEIADRLRLILMKIWRGEAPTIPSERPEDQRRTYLIRWQLGLAAIYAEAEDHNWVRNINADEAALASRYALIDFNLPHWMPSLIDAYPNQVDAIVGNELSWELNSKLDSQSHSILLQSIQDTTSSVASIFIPRLQTWITSYVYHPEEAEFINKAAERLRQVIRILLKHGEKTIKHQLLMIAIERLQADLPLEFLYIWLPTLMKIDPEQGVLELEKVLNNIKPELKSEALTWFGLLFGDRFDTVNLRSDSFTPAILLRLLRLAYQYVRRDEDVDYEHQESSGIRNDAERARNEIVAALFDAKGEDGWAAKLEMANDPLCAHFRDRIFAVAEERWAQQIDSDIFSDAQFVALDKTGEAPASTKETMFSIMTDRLTDLDDLLLQDISPKETWAGIESERVMRREIARELRNAANNLYKVDQEAATAEEKETDIRLRSVTSNHEAVIELKLADNRSAQDLVQTIYDQLVLKYMASENSRSGCLLITIAINRMWEHPETGKRIGLGKLKDLLMNEAKRVEHMMGGAVLLAVHVLDLRPRLSKE